MRAQDLYRAVALSLLVPVALGAQVVRDEAPLKNWQAPLYWQPTHAENQGTAMTPDGARNVDGEDHAISTSNLPPFVFVGITPCRVVDTRVGQGFTGAFGPPGLAGSSSRTFPIQSSTTCAIPSIAKAYSLNVIMVPQGFLGSIKIYPTGQNLPLAETLSSMQGSISDNAIIAPAGTGGSVDAYASDPTNLIIDINGYYVPASGISLAQGTASEPALHVSGDAGTGMFSSQPGTLNLAAGGTEVVTLSSIGDMNVAGRIHANGPISSGNSVSVNGLTNSITVDSATPPVAGKPNEIYIGVDNGGAPDAALFSKIKVGIGTRSVTPGDSKIKILDSNTPALELNSGPARLQLAVAPCVSCYSTVASPGDAVIRANAGKSEDLILAASNGNQGAIRFTTGLAQGCGVPGAESQKMVLTNAGNLGIGPNFTTGQFCGGPATVTERLDVDGQARIRSLPLDNTPNNNVVVANADGVLFSRDAKTLGGVNGTCSSANFVTKWSAPKALTCSQIIDDGVSVGIGTIPNPGNKVAIHYSDSTKGASVLSLANDSGTFTETETGVLFEVNANDAARIYAKFDGTGVFDSRLTLQSLDELSSTLSDPGGGSSACQCLNRGTSWRRVS